MTGQPRERQDLDAINLTGSDFANSIYGNNGANVIFGKGCNDTLSGHSGVDIFVFDNYRRNRDYQPPPA